MRKLLLALPLVLLLGAAAPSGTIALNQPAPRYGDSVTFTTNVSGHLRNGFTYTNVVCAQGADIVYQYSSRDPSFAFPLADQAGLEWDGQAASCIGSLVYRVEHGRNTTITYLAQTTFDVEAQL